MTRQVNARLCKCVLHTIATDPMARYTRRCGERVVMVNERVVVGSVCCGECVVVVNVCCGECVVVVNVCCGDCVDVLNRSLW